MDKAKKIGMFVLGVIAVLVVYKKLVPASIQAKLGV